MTMYMISFPTGVMDVPDGEWDQVVRESHQVVADMKAAGVYVFGGGIEESIAPVRVHADGTITHDTYPQTGGIAGGYSIVNCETRADAEAWAARIAASCRCPQELREFQFDPES